MKGKIQLTASRSTIKNLLLGILLVAGCAAPNSAMIGKASLDISLRDQDNQQIKLSNYQGKQSLVLVFYNSST